MFPKGEGERASLKKELPNRTNERRPTTMFLKIFVVLLFCFVASRIAHKIRTIDTLTLYRQTPDRDDEKECERTDA